ncbi:MAG: 2-deoxy-5-keto-D-gluconate 6-phosphate aldolase domain-containing protein [Ktedonobacterales bacterium]
MLTGYTQPLAILPFDHRSSYISGLFGWKEPLNVEQALKVAESKQAIYEGFKKAQIPKEEAGILVDEQYGIGILRDATEHGTIVAVSVEKSGQDEFEFAYGDDFAKHIEAIQPTFAKVLVRYNPEGNRTMNRRQISRLKRLSDYLHETRRLFLFELLVPAEPEQLERVDQNQDTYDTQFRPRLMVWAIEELRHAGVEPDVWKIEGLDQRADGERMVEVAHQNGGQNVGLIVLGRGASPERVRHWLLTAASVPGFIGFAVGRTCFWTAIVDFLANRLSPDAAATQIAGNFEEWYRTFNSGRQADN